MTLPTPDTTNVAGVAGAPFSCSLGGRAYVIDLKSGEFIERTIPLLRNQFISDSRGGQVESEGSLNPEDLVRRSWDSWHLGAGQTHRDRNDSIAERFYTSRAIVPWNKWKLSLSGIFQSMKTTTTAVNNGVCTAGIYLYLADGNNVYFTSSTIPAAISWTTATGTPAVPCTGICTDGLNIYAAFGASGVYTCVAGAAAMTLLYNTGTIARVFMLKDRLFAHDGVGKLYNPTDFTTPPNALPTAMLDKGTSWTWGAAAEGNSHVYFVGSRNNQTVIYKSAVKPDGTAMDTPTVACSLPPGEAVTAIIGYMGYMVLGIDPPNRTDDTGAYRTGFRLAQMLSDGNLVLGKLTICGTGQIKSFAAFDRFIYFGWKEDATTTGNGVARIDLSTFTSDLTPAYARDTEFTVVSTDTVDGMCFYQNALIARAGTSGVYYEGNSATTTRVSYGDIYFGKMSYGLTDDKVAMFVDVAMTAAATSSGTSTCEVFLDVNGAGRVSYGSLTASGSIDLGGVTGAEFQISLKLSRDSAYTYNGATIDRVTMRSFVAANRTREWVVPLIIAPHVRTMNNQDYFYPSVRTEIDAIRAMMGTIVVWKVGTLVEYVQIKDYQWQPDKLDPETGEYGGVMTLKLQVVHT